jgi:hypothetical protein
MTDILRYPIGDFDLAAPVNAALRGPAIDAIAALPARLREAVRGLTDRQLDTPYRPGGWTVRQLVHHIADSHMNGVFRVKLALTENAPTIKPYDENTFAALPDSRLPIEPSLSILEGLHIRWVAIYRGLAPEQFDRTFFHPEHGRMLTLEQHLQSYGWHSRHHVAHITSLRQREGW